MMGDRSIEGIFPRPLKPSSEDLKKFGLAGSALQIAFLRAGVPAGLSGLDSEEIYALLYELPEKVIDGKIAKKLYRWLIESSELTPDTGGQNYKLFASKGKIWARIGTQEGYFPVAKTHYVDVEGLPTALLEDLTIADLPKKRGADKIARLFALRTIDRSSVTEQVEHHISAPCAASADANFQQAKPYILALRQSYSAQSQQLDLLRHLHLEVSTSVTAVIHYDGHSVHHRLHPWSYAIHKNNLYIACDPSKPTSVSAALLSNVIGEAVAAIFGLTDGNAFAQLYQCDESDRKRLLMRLLGEDQETVIEELLISGDSIPQTQHATIILPINGIDGDQDTDIDAADDHEEDDQLPESKSENDDVNDDQESGVWKKPENITVEPVAHTAESSQGHIDLKVSARGRRENQGAQLGAIRGTKADGEVGEILAVMFEKQAGRFPVRVGHITGYLAPGCDILSFRSAEDKAAFLTGQEHNSALVDRFIEAKARSGGAVELTGHEWNAARQWGTRYFVYRFERDQENGNGYLLTVLNDPQSAEEAHTPVIHLSLDRARRAERYKIHSVDIAASDQQISES